MALLRLQDQVMHSLPSMIVQKTQPFATTISVLAADVPSVVKSTWIWVSLKIFCLNDSPIYAINSNENMLKLCLLHSDNTGHPIFHEEIVSQSTSTDDGDSFDVLLRKMKEKLQENKK